MVGGNGIHEVYQNRLVSFCPNPAKSDSNLYLEAKERSSEKKIHLLLHDIPGRKRFFSQLQSGQFLEPPDLLPGIYKAWLVTRLTFRS